MQTAIIASKKDPAGMNIAGFLKNYNLKDVNATLHIVDEESIYCENIDKKIEADLFIFATKHQSQSKIPSLSVHSPGNWGKAELGGKDRTLCVCPASYIKNAFLELKNNKLGYDPVMEITHHGPFLEKPVMFMEIGSSLEYWQDKKAGEFIANVIVNILKNTKRYEAVVGFGGLHTCPELSKINTKTEYALSHVCPKYNLQNLDKEMILQAIDKTQEEIKFILLDWKGLGPEKERIKNIVEELKIPYKKISKI